MTQKPKPTSFLHLKDQDSIAELILFEESPPELGFLVYNRKSKLKTFETELSIGEEKFCPPKNSQFVSKKIPLPSGASEYKEGELLKEIRELIHRYVELDEQAEAIISYYIVFTWLFDQFRAVPYLRALGDYDTGKGRFLEIMEQLCYKPFYTVGATPAIVFRMIDEIKGTIILDEADLGKSDKSQELLDLLNAGYKKGAVLARAVSDSKKMLIYEVYGPKIFATRRQFRDSALESRCLTIDTMGLTREDIPFHLPPEFFEKAGELRNKLLQFRFDHWGRVEVDESLRMGGIPSRLNEILLPLLSIFKGKKAQKEIYEFALKYARKLSTIRSEEIPTRVLEAIIEASKSSLVLRDFSGTVLVPFNLIVETFNVDKKKERGDYILTSHVLGRVVRGDLKLETKRAKHTRETHVAFDAEEVKKRCVYYGIDWPAAEEDDK